MNRNLSAFAALTMAFAALLGIATPTPGWALTKEVKALVRYETRANAAATNRMDTPVKIEHFEIPLSVLEVDIAERLPEDIRKSVIFERDGEKWVRWVINPEDTKWYKDVEKFLKSKGLSAERKQWFTGYMTASRSYILEDPKTHAQFSGKVSTNKTGGNWTDKKQPVDDAKQVRMASDFVDEQSKLHTLENIVIMDEPAMFGIREIDQAFLIRTLAELPEKPRYYLPGFSAVHDETGKLIAKRNGSLNPAEYWNEHYNKPLGKGLAEFAARTGLTFDSPHSQNFLVELDEDLKPTGKIVIRDFGDTYAMKEFFTAMGKADFLKRWETDNVISGRLSVSIGTLHGNQFPSWMDDAVYKDWGRDFYASFEQRFSEITGVSAKEVSGRLSQSGRYFSKSYGVAAQGWKSYFRGLASDANKALLPDTCANVAKPRAVKLKAN